jgi:hypothetical protein
MMQFIKAAFVVLTIGPFALGSTPTMAQGQNCPRSGMCPAGQCAKDGGRLACDTANCSASNCRGDRSGRSGPATSKAQFCSVWHAVCNRVCRDGALCVGKCQQRHNTCNSTGCFDLWDRNRCFSNPRDVELTDPKYYRSGIR